MLYIKCIVCMQKISCGEYLFNKGMHKDCKKLGLNIGYVGGKCVKKEIR